ncbi:response regulator [Paenibacillus arenilitoris]|uniref:Response regulator n=1 Tax=Paenibacillus arenilitoris TaxID=2772299 RepID=A0A927CK17_9BACL|nr:response regulator [Paenibacillus arenilitoris]MBD2868959.1 response regulator [Paenibacillus arenilitoris]
MSMYRLLIVDDEPYTVDGLYEMLQETDLEELELYRAYSADEALHWLGRVKIDIVLSDIKMPGMDGLGLHRRIKQRWPRCKVIFLTGMNDSEYVRQCLRDGGVDYILKTEGDEPIVASIRSAIERLEEELHNDRFMRIAKERFAEALPVLRNDWFRRLLHDGAEDAGLTQSRLADLACPLHADAPVLPVLLRVDRWPVRISVMDRQLLIYAMENIISEYFTAQALQMIALDDSCFMLLVQPGNRSEPEREGILRFVRGTLETVQRTCGTLLHLPVSVMCGHEQADWANLPETYFRMKKALVLSAGPGDTMMLFISNGGTEGSCENRGETMLARLRERLDTVLEGGRSEEAHAVISAWFEGAHDYAVYLEAYYTIANKFIGLVNRWGWVDRLYPVIRLERLMDIQSHHSREQAIGYLQKTAEHLIALKKNVQDERADRIVDKVNKFIRGRIAYDVSLTALAEAVYLNPSYLSLLYKQTTGQNISDYITNVRLEKARELLAATPLKIHEVAAAIGFDNAGYFTRFFRKHTGIGPQDYRNQAFPK